MIDPRWWLAMVVAGAYALYHPLNLRPSKYYWEWTIDRQLPLLPHSVWVYCTYFIVLPLAIVSTWHTPQIEPLLISIIVAKAVSLPIWYFWPNGVKRPALPHPKNLSEKLLATIYHHDNDTNGCPSSHVFTSLIATWFLSQAFPHWALACWGWGIAITISTITTKQHYVIDVLWGVVVTVGSIWVAGAL